MEFYETISLLFFILRIIIINDIVVYKNITKYFLKKKFILCLRNFISKKKFFFKTFRYLKIY